MTIRVVLGEDNVLVREGVRALLNSYDDVEVVGVAEDAPSLLAAAAEHVPDAQPDRADDRGEPAERGGHGLGGSFRPRAVAAVRARAHA